MAMKPTIANTKVWEQNALGVEKLRTDERKKVFQTISFKVGNFDDTNRTFRAIGSTSIVDRQGDVIEQDGWDLDNFMLNPVIPFAHDYYQLPVGRAIEVGVQDGVLQFTYQAPPKGMYDFADTVWEYYRNQFMFAFSVGFIPKGSDGGDLDEWSWEGNTFSECELLEISAVVVPANPQAVALSVKGGYIDTKQAKQLMSKMQGAVKSLQESLEDEVKATDEAEKLVVSMENIETAIAKAVSKALDDYNPEGLTSDKTNQDNNTMSKSTIKTSAITLSSMGDNLKDVADTLAAHSKALDGHVQTLAAHSALIQQKAVALSKAADYLKSANTDPDGDGLNDNSDLSDELTDPNNENPDEKLDSAGKEAEKSVKGQTKDVETPEVPEVPEVPVETPEVAETPEVPVETPEVEAPVEAPAEEAPVEEAPVETPAVEAPVEPVVESGEVKSEDVPTDGADHEELSDDTEVDPEDLTEAQAEEVLKYINDELAKSVTD